jgi:hypothetical protein
MSKAHHAVAAATLATKLGSQAQATSQLGMMPAPTGKPAVTSAANIGPQAPLPEDTPCYCVLM